MDFLGPGRDRPANYIEICNNLADSYPQGTYHGVQKDAIQNSYDARNKKLPVLIVFELFKNSKGKEFFIFSDQNTTGLTGPILTKNKDYEGDLPENYRWARFESFAFTKKSEDAIGARGQGKFIFLKASDEYTMLYDSLFFEGGKKKYRFGATEATKTGCPIYPDQGTVWEDERAVQELKNLCGLEPLKEIGTRIIIESPGHTELILPFLIGAFEKAIQETWFRLIEQDQIRIFIKKKGKLKSIKPPEIFPLPKEDTRNALVWRLGSDFTNNEIQTSEGNFKIKTFHAVFFKKDAIEEGLKGIALIHNGMKICSLHMEFAPADIRERIVGYVEFDKELDRELRKGANQDPNHYRLRFRSTIPREIKAYVNSQLNEFGRQKLGIRPIPVKNKRELRSDAEEWALRQLQRFAKDLDLFGAKGKSRPPNPDLPPPFYKQIGIAINSFLFPDPDLSPRVNHGERFENFFLNCFNKTDDHENVAATLEVFYGDKVILDLLKSEVFQLKENESREFGNFSIDIFPAVFKEPGKYRLEACLFEAETGKQIDQVARIFWVEKDPPFRQPFDINGSQLPEPFEKRQWVIENDLNNSPIFHYNTDHPAYRLAEHNEITQREYLLEIIIDGALHFVLKRGDDVDGTPDYHPLEKENIIGKNGEFEKTLIPEKTFEEISRYRSELKWRMHENE